ncbi:MAG: toprim domain-containing protein [Candidatus Scalindua sp.]|nr:toprim domain-containing protein [Candidatus Scalindua sp.]
MNERTVCPKCSHTRKKSFEKTRSVSGNLYHCFHCGDSGIVGVDGKDIPSGTKGKPRIAPLDPAEKLKGLLPANVLEFFSGRGISSNTLRRNKIEFEDGFIKFPYFWKGELVNIKYRSLDKKFKQEKDRDRVFFGLDDIGEQKEIIITEGEIDKLSLNEVGYLNCVSVPDGAPTPNTKTYTSKFDFVDNCIDIFKQAGKIIIAVDNDSPGMTLQRELIRRLDPVKCWVVEWPEGCKDANDVLCKLGKAHLVEVIESAELVPIKGVHSTADFWREISNEYENGGIKRGVSTGLNNVDEYYTVKEGQVTIVTGIPSHGKSTFLTTILINIARFQGWHFAIFSPENNPIGHYASRMAATYIGKPFNKGERERMTPSEVNEAVFWLDSHFKFLLAGDETLFRLDDILRLSKICVQRYGIKGLVIDPWNEIDHTRPGNLTETEHISQSLTRIRTFARIYDVHIWIVAHPMKLQKDKSASKYPVPTAYDISGSAHWRNKADNIFCVHRDEMDESRLVDIHVQKIRFREVGQPGVVELRFDVATGRYFDVSTSEKLIE